MKLLCAWTIVLLGGAAIGNAHAMPYGDRSTDGANTILHLIGNTSSNSSSNTSSNSSSGRSSYVHTHSWSVDSDDGYRRRATRGTTRIERYGPTYRRYDRQRRYRHFGMDDD
jgi:hypothetical protein